MDLSQLSRPLARRCIQDISAWQYQNTTVDSVMVDVLLALHLISVRCYAEPGPRLDIKTVFPRYGDSHVKGKTVGETVLSLTWESLYW